MRFTLFCKRETPNSIFPVKAKATYTTVILREIQHIATRRNSMCLNPFLCTVSRVSVEKSIIYPKPGILGFLQFFIRFPKGFRKVS